MKTKKKSKTKKVVKLKTKKVASLAKGVDIVKKADGTLVITGKNAKELEGAIVEQKERQYKFDERLVPYYLGSDSRDGNLALRKALTALGKTDEMTELFSAMRTAELGYKEDGRDTFIKALFAVIKGHDSVGLQTVFDNDIKAIEENNYKTFDEFFKAKELIVSGKDDEYEGFSN